MPTSESAGNPVPTQAEAKMRLDRDIYRRYANMDLEDADTVWAYYAHSLTRALVNMHGTIELKGFVCDVPIERIACARITLSRTTDMEVLIGLRVRRAL